jgi:hypothetical protein
MARGGARAGAGRPKGSEEQATLDKRANRALIREAAKPHIARIVQAQAENAVGVSYMVLRDPVSGAYVRATDEQAVDAALAAGPDAFRIYTKEPHSGSAAMVLAYAADKPVEAVELSGPDGGPVEISAILHAARERLARAKRGE